MSDRHPVAAAKDHTAIYAALDLQAIREIWGDLAETCLPGTPKPWAEAYLTPEVQAARDEVAKADRAARIPDARKDRRGLIRLEPLGESPAPGNVNALSVKVEVETALLDLEHRVRRALGFSPALRAATIDGSDTNWAYWAGVWVEDALGAVEHFPDLLADVASTARRALRQMRQAIGLMEPRLHLKADCFVCGQRTLFLYAGQRVVDSYVSCHGDGCNPTDAQCGSWLRGRPTWSQAEFDWLNGQLRTLVPAPRKRAEGDEVA